MAILEIEKDDLLRLSADGLEELVFRLAEAEVSVRGGRCSDVRWAGSLTAPDGGVDVRVSVSAESFEGDFVPRKETIFQVKRSSMPPAEVDDEMRPKDSVAPAIIELSAQSGAYVIVSLADDNADPEHQRRIKAMQGAVEHLEKRHELYLDFYNRSRLHAWLRQHAAVQLWARRVLRKPLSGWTEFGRWSPTPAGVDDSLIFDDGVRALVPGAGNETLLLEDAIHAVRQLIARTPKVVRIAGLSGVGKTRFVQALFEEEIGEAALDRTKVVYADVGDEPEPSARVMLDTLIAEDRDVIVVLDNCPSDLHGRMAVRLSKENFRLKLITVEYDIREDNTQTTEFVRIEANGPGIAEKLIQRRYKELGQLNARKIAEFSQGNCRLALALADAVSAGETLTYLTDAELFDRLFRQRHEHETDFREAAEVLSLVYSFSVETDEDEVDELALLGDLCEKTRLGMHRAAAAMLQRQIAQKRGRWRAVLPHAIANRLATDALNKIPPEALEDVFERRGSARLLTSFARRLGYLHDHPVAQKIVERWLGPDGLLFDFSSSGEEVAGMLMHVAPVLPERTLLLLERQIDEHALKALSGSWNARRPVILNLILRLAYEPQFFERAVELLTRFAVVEHTIVNHDDVQSRIFGLFKLYLAGTHATPYQREIVMRRCLWSEDAKTRDLGSGMLDAALESTHWSSFSTLDFGARPRDHGYHPDYAGRIAWFKRFIRVALECAQSSNPELARQGRVQLAEAFPGLWRHIDLHSLLLDSARSLNVKNPWIEGWRAVRSVLYLDKVRKEHKMCPTIRTKLEALAELLRPKDLVSRIRSIVVGTGMHVGSIDDEFDPEDPKRHEKSLERLSDEAVQLGTVCAVTDGALSEIVGELFKCNGRLCASFGRGLLLASQDPRTMWQTLVDSLRDLAIQHFNFGVLSGALQAISAQHKDLADELLDGCLEDDLLRPCIVGLHPTESFSDRDFGRCLAALDYGGVPVHQFGALLWHPEIEHLSYDRIVALVRRLLQKDGGPSVVLDALSMKLHGEEKSEDVLGQDLRRLGLTAAANHIRLQDGGHDVMNDYHLSQVLNACLPYDDVNAEKNALLDALFAYFGRSHWYLDAYDDALQQIVKHMPSEFLTRTLLDTSIKYDERRNLFHFNVRDKNPLDEIPAETLIEWCRQSNNEEAWTAAAMAIFPFATRNKDDPPSLTNQTLALLNDAPDPVSLITCFGERLIPTSWSGSRADIIAFRIAALESLLESHEDTRVRDAVSKVVRSAKVCEAEEREAEKKEDEEREQRFE